MKGVVGPGNTYGRNGATAPRKHGTAQERAHRARDAHCCGPHPPQGHAKAERHGREHAGERPSATSADTSTKGLNWPQTDRKPPPNGRSFANGAACRRPAQRAAAKCFSRWSICRLIKRSFSRRGRSLRRRRRSFSCCRPVPSPSRRVRSAGCGRSSGRCRFRSWPPFPAGTRALVGHTRVMPYCQK